MCQRRGPISYPDFERINATMEMMKKYAKSRNLASGTLSLDDPEKVKERHVYSTPLRWCNIETILSLGESGWICWKERFPGGGERTPCGADSSDAVERWTKKVENGQMDLPVDGLVICFDDTDYALREASRVITPPAGLAFKWKERVCKVRAFVCGMVLCGFHHFPRGGF